MKQGKSGNKLSDGGGEQKILVNVEDTLCSLMIRIPTKEWDDIRSTVLVFFHTSSQEFLQMEPITYKSHIFLTQQTQPQHNECGRYHPGCCSRSHY